MAQKLDHLVEINEGEGCHHVRVDSRDGVRIDIVVSKRATLAHVEQLTAILRGFIERRDRGEFTTEPSTP